MSYRNPMHGLDGDGVRMSERSATLPAVTADPTVTTGQAAHPAPAPAEPGLIFLDLEYLGQVELERRLAEGVALPPGVSEADVRAWRVAHPDFDPTAPLGGQPVPPGVEVARISIGPDGEMTATQVTITDGVFGIGPDQWVAE
jgi:hypothetical protein